MFMSDNSLVHLFNSKAMWNSIFGFILGSVCFFNFFSVCTFYLISPWNYTFLYNKPGVGLFDLRLKLHILEAATRGVQKKKAFLKTP